MKKKQEAVEDAMSSLECSLNNADRELDVLRGAFEKFVNEDDIDQCDGNHPALGTPLSTLGKVSVSANLLISFEGRDSLFIRCNKCGKPMLEIKCVSRHALY